jgi:uncharacterized protein (TIGR02266 family)
MRRRIGIVTPGVADGLRVRDEKMRAVAMSKVSVEESTSDESTEDERRRTARTDLLVRVEYSTVDELFSEFTRDINDGGLFIETEKPRPAGTEVAMRFNLPGNEQPLQTVGRVVWVRSSGGDAPPGMGIEFDELTRDDRQRINDMIRSLRNGPTASDTTHS